MDTAADVWWYAVGVVAGWAVLRWVLDAFEVDVAQSEWALPVTLTAGVLAAVVAAAAWLGYRGGPRAVTRLLVVATGLCACGLAAVGLHGTRWTFNGLYSDAGFRTQMVTRFADTPALADYGYLGLPAYYPPGLPWLLGRYADLTGQPAWQLMKPGTLLLAAIIPLLTYLLWRRVVPDLPAALVTAALTIFTAHLDKPDEWVVLSLLLPWWLDVVGGVERPGHAWPAWVHGLLLGALLWVHTYFFLPLGVAAVLAVVVHRVRRSPVPRSLPRAMVIVAIGVAVAAPYWLPMMLLRLSGRPTDALQLRWSPLDAGSVVEVSDVLVVACGVLAFVWVARRARRDRLAEALLIAMTGAAGVGLIGLLLQQFDIPLLAEKSFNVVMALGLVAVVLALVEGFGVLYERASRTATRQLVVHTGGLVAAMGIGVASVIHFTHESALSEEAMIAHHTRYPSGERPSDVETDLSLGQPWGSESGPSVVELRETWRRVSGMPPATDPDVVLVTTRVDLVATTPFHTFTAWKSIYSHPNGEYAARLDFLRRVADCRTTRCAADLLRHNRFDRVDGLVLWRAPDGRLSYPVAVDDFPDSWDRIGLRFRPGLFAGPAFTRSDVGDVAVIALR